MSFSLRNSSRSLVLAGLMLVLLFVVPSLADQISGSYDPSSNAGEELIPRGGSRSFHVPISGVSSSAVITNVEAQFEYIAYNGTESGLSCQFNKGVDPGTSGGVTLVSQGNLPAGNPGTYGYIPFSNWNSQSVNGDYYFRFSMADITDYDPTINLISVRITYEIPSITVTYPNIGDTLTKGQDYTVTWTGSNVAGNVKVELYKGSTMVLQLAADDANDGSLPFNPPVTLLDGSDYRFAVTAVDGPTSGYSDYFTIQPFSINSKINAINTHWYNWATSFTDYMERIKNYNFVRDGAWWSGLEESDYVGSSDWANAKWSYPYLITLENCGSSTTYVSGYDGLVEKIQDVDSPELLLLLDIHNNNINTNANSITYEQYYDYVTQIVERYDGDGYLDMPGLVKPVKYFEIGNEVDSENTEHSHDLTIENYVLNRLIPAYLAAKASNPNAVVMNAGLSMGGDSGFNTSYLNNMLSLLRLNGGEQNNYYIDKLALHYYSDSQNPEHLFQNIQQVKNILSEYSLDNIPIWMTEFGVATKHDAGGTIREEDQASVLLRYLVLMKAQGIQNEFIYSLKDNNTSDPANWENVYGILGVTCSGDNQIIYEKESARVIDFYLNEIEGFSFDSINSQTERDSGIYSVTFKKGNQRIKILWYTAFDGTGVLPDLSSETQSVQIDLNGSTGSVYTMDGGLLYDQVQDLDQLILGESPLVVKYAIPEVQGSISFDELNTFFGFDWDIIDRESIYSIIQNSIDDPNYTYTIWNPLPNQVIKPQTTAWIRENHSITNRPFGFINGEQIITPWLDSAWGNNISSDNSFNTVFAGTPTTSDKFEVISFIDQFAPFCGTTNDKSYFFTYDTKQDSNGDAVSFDEWVDYLKEIAASYGRPIDTLTIFAHGSSASVRMSDAFNIENNLETQEAIVRLKNENILSNDATILLFSCDVAKDVAGKELIQNLANWSGAVVYASSNKTGPYVLDGTFVSQDWDLDVVRQPVVSGTSSPPIAAIDVIPSSLGNTTVVLDGSNSIAESGISSYLWEQIGGTPITIVDPTSQQASIFTPDVSQSETLTFQLTVTDSDDEQATQICTIEILPTGTIPYSPSEINVEYQSDLQQNLIIWNHVSHALSYRVYWGTNSGVTISSNILPDTEAIKFGHTGVQSGSCYYYRVAAVNSAGESGLSPEKSICLPSLVPDVPAGVNAVYQEASDRNYISWDSASNATSYKIYWGTEIGVTKDSERMPETFTSDYGHTGVEGGYCYYYRVAAVNLVGESELSEEINSCIPITDTDQDGIADYLDAFPSDPAASEDTDGDGYPDSWNNGYSQDDSTTGLSLDEFIYNPTEWVDSDNDGAGDNSDAYPLNPDQKWQYPILAPSQFHTAYIHTDGTLWAWGLNYYGQLGDGTTIEQHLPKKIGLDTDWEKIVSGYTHTIALKTDGSLWGWGENTSGQIGIGIQSLNVLSPVQIGNDKTWIQIATGSNHSLGLKADGSLWAWGRNNYGQIGDGSSENRLSPVQIGNDYDWSKVYLSDGYSTYALKSDGSLWAWGDNTYGQLGDGTATTRYIPTRIGNDSNWVSISAGGLYAIGLKSDGTIWGWGYNGAGRIGDGTTVNHFSPVQIGSSNNWSQIAVGGGHNLALSTDGSLWGWGLNSKGSVGIGTVSGCVLSPTQIGYENDWENISAYGYSSFSLKNNSNLWGWGGNIYGELGDGTTIDRYVPTQIIFPAFGSISVNISPQEGIDDGAQWRIDGGTWQDSGVTVSSLLIGSHTVEFSSISGWSTPPNQTVEILANSTTSVQATYTPVVITGFGKVSEGLAALPVFIALDHDFTVDFTITETLGAPITYEQIVVAILDADGNHLFDIPQTFSDETLTANGTWTGSVTGNIVSSNPAGGYQAVLRGKVSGGDWFDFETVSPAMNPVSFDVIENQNSGDRIRITSTDDISEVDPAWAPDGSRILYQTKNIFTNNVAGDDPVQVTFLPDPRHAWGGVYRPNTDRIYYLDNSYPTGLDYWWICWTNADGSAGRNQIWQIPGGQSISPISFSPDGTQFVFIHRQEMAIYIMNADGTLDHKISGISAEGNVSWGRGVSSNKLLYNIKIGEVYTLNVIDVDGSNNTQLTDVNMGSCNYPSWTPDGSAVVFARTSDNQIYRMNLDGSELTALTNDPYINVYPEISPDGNTLLYASREEGGFYDIYQLNLSGDVIDENILFEDSFNDNSIDSEKWPEVLRNDVTESDGIMKVETNVTDSGGILRSKSFYINNSEKIEFKRRVNIGFGNNYFIGKFRIYIDDYKYFGIDYGNMVYDSGVYDSSLGFFIVRNCSTHDDSSIGSYSERIEPIWDQWFDEKIIYDPVTGLFEYFINENKVGEYFVDSIAQLERPQMHFHFDAWGWGTGHHHYFDNFTVTQKATDSDSDGVYDSMDNCPSIANPDQNDANTNGIGNACDTGSDTDNDSLTDAQEYILGTDPDNADTDGDGIPDGIDPEPLIPAASYVAHNDLNADGTSDILLRNATNGQWRMFTMGNMIPTSQSGIVLWANQNWVYQDMADYDADGDADVLMRNSTDGNWRLFTVQDGAIISNTAPNLWRNLDYIYQGSADFDADGDADILLRDSTTGFYRLFTVQDGAIIGSVTLATLWHNSLWNYAGTGDFDGDGDADILLRNTNTGEWRLFIVQNGNITGSHGFNAWQNLNWMLQGIADYDKDGDADLLMRDINGYWQIFAVQNGQVISSNVIYLWQNTSWVTQSAQHDLDGDGDADVLLRNSSTGLWRSFSIENLSVIGNNQPFIWANQDWQMQ